MRDPDRLDPMLYTIRQIWQRYPDMRLGQLLVNAINPNTPCPEIFHAEDEVLLAKLQGLLQRAQSRDSGSR